MAARQIPPFSTVSIVGLGFLRIGFFSVRLGLSLLEDSRFMMDGQHFLL